MMRNEMMKREIEEAIQAGEKALFSLRAAEGKLKSAKNWGIFDMLVGGVITDLVKHSKIDDASNYIENAKNDLQIFQRELKDVQINMNLQMDISKFLSFADFFFDGIIADYMVQSKIAEAGKQISMAITQVENLLDELKNCKN